MDSLSTSTWTTEEELPERTVFEVFQKRLIDTHKAEPLHQLILIGKISGNCSQDAIKEHYEESIRQIQMKTLDHSSAPTGLLLILVSKIFLHVIEGSEDAIRDVIVTTAKDVKNERLEQAKILTISNDHLFQYWNCYIVYSATQRASALQESSITRQIDDIVGQVMVLGVYFSDVTFTQFESSMKSVLEGASDMIPPEGKLKTLLDERSLLTAQEYIDRYISPYMVVMDEELVWPIPEKLLV